MRRNTRIAVLKHFPNEPRRREGFHEETQAIKKARVPASNQDRDDGRPVAEGETYEAAVPLPISNARKTPSGDLTGGEHNQGALAKKVGLDGPQLLS